MQSQNTRNTLSRRNWLRNTVIATTGAAVLPSLLTSCTDHVIPEPGGLGSATPLTEAELQRAAQNLIHMEAWVRDVYVYTGNYEDVVYHLLNSGQKPTDWKDFIINVLVQIALGLLEAAGAATGTKFLFAGPEIAITAALVRQFASPGRPANLEAEFAEFELGHLEMQKAISDKLLTLADETDNYSNLREAWPGELDFNGEKYTLKDLADSQFPTVDTGTEYVELRTAAYEDFRKNIWNLMVMKAGYLNTYYIGGTSVSYPSDPREYIREYIYTDNPKYDYYTGSYARVYNDGFENFYRIWTLEFDGKPLSAAAAEELFIDGTPDWIINPDKDGKPTTGLFPRDYVYKQFHIEKPYFRGYFDTTKPGDDSNGGIDYSSEDFEFTGGAFPILAKL